jgi:hypothetical protein
MIYKYNNISNPNLEQIEINIRASSLVSTFLFLVWNKGCNAVNKMPCNSKCEQPCNNVLRVNLNRELTPEEKIILDNLVAQI